MPIPWVPFQLYNGLNVHFSKHLNTKTIIINYYIQNTNYEKRLKTDTE